MIFDKTGSLANTKRHDYLPFGEELIAGQGLRTSAIGYVADNVRQKFTLKERDNETGLDYFGARYYGSTQGRFTSPDPFSIILLRQNSPKDDKAQEAFLQFVGDPRRWNRFAYAVNSPLVFTDKTGLDIVIIENGPTKNPNDSKSGGNPLGHTAIAITGRGVFSMGNGQGDENLGNGNNNIMYKSLKEYIKRELGSRDTKIYIIKTTPAQDAAAEQALVMMDVAGPRLEANTIVGDNCSSRVNSALDAAGIAPGRVSPNLPGSAGARATNDPGFAGTIEIPQDSNLLLSDLKTLKQFEPRSPIPAPGTPGGTPVVTMKAITKRVPNDE
jgi:RHS repeat-associated protein